MDKGKKVWCLSKNTTVSGRFQSARMIGTDWIRRWIRVKRSSVCQRIRLQVVDFERLLLPRLGRIGAVCEFFLLCVALKI